MPSRVPRRGDSKAGRTVYSVALVTTPLPSDRSQLEHELKYLVPATRVALVRSLLEARCRPDARYPVNRVVSIYYDTADLEMLEDKFAGQLCKRKVRVRWYEGGGEPVPVDAPAFLEIKYRFGSGRHKVRLPAKYPARWYQTHSLADPALALLPGRRQESEDLPSTALYPFLVVGYERRRYYDPLSRSRISLDTEIGPGRFNSTRLPHGQPRALRHAVLEVKNGAGETPPALLPAARLGALPRAFSKYSACFESCCWNEPPDPQGELS